MSKETLSSTTIQKNKQMLHVNYTFDNFIVGNSNRDAYTVAYSVAESLGQKYNPVFIYGLLGLGKTHLLHAIGHYAEKQGKIVIYTTVEKFMNDFTDHSRNQTMDVFREKYRTCDVLLVDEIDYIASKFHTQGELYHTFNELYLANKQIVVTSNTPLDQINGLSEPLKSRLGGGLITDLGILDEETKREIIKKKSALHNLVLTEKSINDLVANIGDDVRKIESAILRLSHISQ